MPGVETRRAAPGRRLDPQFRLGRQESRSPSACAPRMPVPRLHCGGRGSVARHRPRAHRQLLHAPRRGDAGAEVPDRRDRQRPGSRKQVGTGLRPFLPRFPAGPIRPAPGCRVVPRRSPRVPRGACATRGRDGGPGVRSANVAQPRGLLSRDRALRRGARGAEQLPGDRSALEPTPRHRVGRGQPGRSRRSRGASAARWRRRGRSPGGCVD